MHTSNWKLGLSFNLLRQAGCHLATELLALPARTVQFCQLCFQHLCFDEVLHRAWLAPST